VPIRINDNQSGPTQLNSGHGVRMVAPPLADLMLVRSCMRLPVLDDRLLDPAVTLADDFCRQNKHACPG
jgi:hypothetical protein